MVRHFVAEVKIIYKESAFSIKLCERVIRYFG